MRSVCFSQTGVIAHVKYQFIFFFLRWGVVDFYTMVTNELRNNSNFMLYIWYI